MAERNSGNDIGDVKVLCGNTEAESHRRTFYSEPIVPLRASFVLVSGLQGKL